LRHIDTLGIQIIAPIFKKLSEKPEYEGVVFARLNTETQEEVSTKCGVRAMPTFIVFKNGKNVDSTRGAVPAALEVCCGFDWRVLCVPNYYYDQALIKKAAALPQVPSTGAIETAPAPLLAADRPVS